MWRLKKKIAGESFRYGETTIRVYVDESVDAARVVLGSNPVAFTKRIEGLGNGDFDADGDLVALEIFRFSEQIGAWRARREPKPEPERDLADDLQAFASRWVERAKEMSNAQ